MSELMHKTNRLVIIGAGGHGKVVADIAMKNLYSNIFYVDDIVKGSCMGISIIGTSTILDKLNDDNTDFIIAVGNNERRKEIAQKYDLNWVTLVHPSAHVGINVKLGIGTVIMAGAVINPCTTIGNHCIINTCAVVEHDNILNDYVHISPNVALGGTVCVGEATHVGIGATVKNNVNICSNCIIGAGAVVVDNLNISGIYIGLPAKIYRGSKNE